jgi:hypothetical protein
LRPDILPKIGSILSIALEDDHFPVMLIPEFPLKFKDQHPEINVEDHSGTSPVVHGNHVQCAYWDVNGVVEEPDDQQRSFTLVGGVTDQDGHADVDRVQAQAELVRVFDQLFNFRIPISPIILPFRIAYAFQ